MGKSNTFDTYIITFAVNAMFKTGISLTMNMVLMPLILAMAFIGGIFMIPLSNIKKSNLFEELRENV